MKKYPHLKAPLFFDFDNIFIRLLTIKLNKNDSVIATIDAGNIYKNFSVITPEASINTLKVDKLDYIPRAELFLENNCICEYLDGYLGFNYITDNEGNLMVYFGLMSTSSCNPVIIVNEKLNNPEDKDKKLLYKRLMNHTSIFDVFIIKINTDIKIINFTDLSLDTIPKFNDTVNNFLSNLTLEKINEIDEQI